MVYHMKCIHTYTYSSGVNEHQRTNSHVLQPRMTSGQNGVQSCKVKSNQRSKWFKPKNGWKEDLKGSRRSIQSQDVVMSSSNKGSKRQSQRTDDDGQS